jgi:hypothetical protein
VTPALDLTDSLLNIDRMAGELQVTVELGPQPGALGSGYRGKRVLRRAHVPILNVRYDGDACGPYPDWQNEEGRFEAQGTAVAPGFRLCPPPATTVPVTTTAIFAGVAVYVDGDEVVLVSELEAGWYRYVSRWHLHANGTIRPLGYVLVPGPGTARPMPTGWGTSGRCGTDPTSCTMARWATSTRAHIDNFANGESIVGTNVVVWYAAHFTHDPAHEDDHGGGAHIVGPTLKPVRW